MTRIAPHKAMAHRQQAEKPAADRSLNRRTRVVAGVVVGLLLVHVLAVVFILFVANWAAADVETRLAQSPSTRPSVAVRAGVQHAAQASQGDGQHTAVAAIPNDWLAQASRKDPPAPWRMDTQGAVRWFK